MKMSKYDQLRTQIKGPVFSILTPFNQDESIDFDALEKYIEQIDEAGGKIFFVMGYNSRYSQLSWDEIKQLNQFVTEKVKQLNPNHIVIVADPLHCSTKVSIEFANHASDIGADIISLIVRERFYSESQIFNHFKLVTEESDTPILIHEMPFLNGFGGPSVNWPVSLLDELSDLENIVAIKEDAKDDDYSKEVITKIKDRVSIILSGGGQEQWLRFVNMGCQAWLNGIGVFEPKLAIKFWNHYQKGNKDAYMKIVNLVEKPFFEEGIKKFTWHLVIKAALQSRGIMKRYDRMPLQCLNGEDYSKVKELMKKLPIDSV